MYQLFINDRPLMLSSAPEAGFETHLTLPFASTGQLISIIEKLDRGLLSSAFVVCPDADALWSNLIHTLRYIEAAGGLVCNPSGQVLIIKRWGRWEFPKGKIEIGEVPEEAAKREVEEECGVGLLKIVKELPSTFHTYHIQGKLALKRTFWFLMEAEGNQNPFPQAEEGIEEAKWEEAVEANRLVMQSFRSIGGLMAAANLGQTT